MAVEKFPSQSNEISGLVMMAISGGAVIPLLVGWVSDISSIASRDVNSDRLYGLPFGSINLLPEKVILHLIPVARYPLPELRFIIIYNKIKL